MCPDKVMSGTPLKRWVAQWLFVSFGEREQERACERETLEVTEGSMLLPYYYMEYNMYLSVTLY